MDEDYTPEQRAASDAALQSLLAELRTKKALRNEIDELKKRADGVYAVGARVETREETSKEWGRWSEPSSVGEITLVRRATERAPIQPATYDVRLPDAGDASSVASDDSSRWDESDSDSS